MDLQALCQGRGRAVRVVQAVDGLDFRGPATAASAACLAQRRSGKTTLAHRRRAAGGRRAVAVRIDGIDVATQRGAALARVGVLSDARGLYPRLTARENIVYYGRLHGLTVCGAGAGRQLARMLQMEPLLERRNRGLQPGRAHEDGAGARAGARPAQHHPRTNRPTGWTCMATRALREGLRRLRDEQASASSSPPT